MAIFLISCNNGEDIIEKEKEQDFRSFYKQMNLPSDLDLKITETSTEIDSNSSLKNLRAKLKSSETNLIEYGTVSIKASSAYNELIEVNSITYQHSNNIFYSIIEIKTTVGSGYAKIGFIQENASEIRFVSYEELDENFNPVKTSKGWGDRYINCVGGMFKDDFLGTTLSILGIASGLGCGPCGGVAAAIVGIGAIGCLAT